MHILFFLKNLTFKSYFGFLLLFLGITSSDLIAIMGGISGSYLVFSQALKYRAEQKRILFDLEQERKKAEKDEIEQLAENARVLKSVENYLKTLTND